MDTHTGNPNAVAAECMGGKFLLDFHLFNRLSHSLFRSLLVIMWLAGLSHFSLRPLRWGRFSKCVQIQATPPQSSFVFLV